MKHSKSRNKSFILLGLTLMLGAFLTIIFIAQNSQSKDDFTACEITEFSLDYENNDSDFSESDFESCTTSFFHEFVPAHFVKTTGQNSGNSFVPIFSVSRKILYLQLQLHH